MLNSIVDENEGFDEKAPIFEAVKGQDIVVLFAQEDGTVWSFNGKDIISEEIKDKDLTFYYYNP